MMLYSKPNITTCTTKKRHSKLNKNEDPGRDTLPSPDSSADSFPDEKKLKENTGGTTPITEIPISYKHSTFKRGKTQEKGYTYHKDRYFSPGVIVDGTNRTFEQPGFGHFPQHACFSNTFHYGVGAGNKHNVYNYVNVNIPFSSYLVNLANTFNRSKSKKQYVAGKVIKPENIAYETAETTEIGITDIDDNSTEMDVGDDKAHLLTTNAEEICIRNGLKNNNNRLKDVPNYLYHYQMQNFEAFSNNQSIHPIFLQLPEIGPRRSGPEKQPAAKKYTCDICSRNFSRSNTLITHKRIHSGDKPFKCETCDRAFRQPGNLTRHRLTHTSIKPYVCATCNKAFNRASNLSTHMRTHSNIKAYTCLCCGKLLHHDFDFQAHSCLQNDRCHKCDICGRGFGMKSTLNAHRQIHHRK